MPNQPGQPAGHQPVGHLPSGHLPEDSSVFAQTVSQIIISMDVPQIVVTME